MPCINVGLQPGGPLLRVLVGVSSPRAQALTSAGLQVPTGVQGTFLVDTGASCTCADPDLIQSLGLQPTGRTAIQTPSTASGPPHFCDQYDVSIFIPGNPAVGGGHLVAALPIIATHLRSQNIDGLIGRDVLNGCTLIYNGTASIFTLAY
jgi:hypothetical protein